MRKESKKRELFFIRRAANLLEPYTYNSDKAWEKVRRQSIERPPLRRQLNWLRYAAVFVAGMGVVWGAYRLGIENKAPEVSQTSSYIPAAAQQPELILATGQRVILSDSVRGREVTQGSINVFVDSMQSCLKYAYRDTSATGGITGYNTLRVPKGKMYSLELPDGSLVQLNAESSIRFPVAFAKNIRKVYLEGEAFFHVRPNAGAPFHVYAAGRDICVLGTSFNVSAYGDAPFFESTLVSGKVKVEAEGKEVVLQPSEQYFEDRRSGKSGVRQVDVQLCTSWTEGKIRFKRERLEDIVTKLKRWYDFEIFYASEETKDMRFGGVINKSDSFETVLKHLEQTTHIQFSIRNRTVIVRKNYNH